MKNISKLIAPILIIGLVYLISSVARTNYDLRYLESKTVKVLVSKKNLKPAGSSFKVTKIGNLMKSLPTYNQEELTLIFMFSNIENQVIVNKDKYKDVAVGDEITVTYYEPKYYGDPFSFNLKSGE